MSPGRNLNHRLLRYLPAALAAAVLLALIPFAPRFPSSEIYATRTGEVRDFPLPDGSRMTLRAQSHLELAYTRKMRRVRLVSGAAFFDVKKNLTRPFVVDAGEVEILVLGTQFDVHRDATQVSVSVLEGHVEVRQHLAEPRRLIANQRAVVKAAQPIIIESFEAHALPRGGR